MTIHSVQIVRCVLQMVPVFPKIAKQRRGNEQGLDFITDGDAQGGFKLSPPQILVWCYIPYALKPSTSVFFCIPSYVSAYSFKDQIYIPSQVTRCPSRWGQKGSRPKFSRLLRLSCSVAPPRHGPTTPLGPGRCLLVRHSAANPHKSSGIRAGCLRGRSRNVCRWPYRPSRPIPI